MKELIKDKVEKEIHKMLEKEDLTMEEINFLSAKLTTIEFEENKEENDKKHKETMEQLLKITTNL